MFLREGWRFFPSIATTTNRDSETLLGHTSNRSKMQITDQDALATLSPVAHIEDLKTGRQSEAMDVHGAETHSIYSIENEI